MPLTNNDWNAVFLILLLLHVYTLGFPMVFILVRLVLRQPAGELPRMVRRYYPILAALWLTLTPLFCLVWKQILPDVSLFPLNCGFLAYLVGTSSLLLLWVFSLISKNRKKEGRSI